MPQEPSTPGSITSPPRAASDRAATGDVEILPRVNNVFELVVSAATIVYALGYLSWAFYSWDRDFGLPPALEGQYLISGLVPAAILIVFLLAQYGLRWLLAKLREPLTNTQERRGVILLRLATGLIVAGFISRWLDFSQVGGALIVIGGVLCIASWWFSADKTDRRFAQGFTWYLSVASTLIFFALFHLFVVHVFPYLPSELGGPAMRAVKLDLKKTEFSPETLALLALETPADGETVRTGSLRIVMPPGDFYVVLLGDSGKPSHLKIRAEAVSAIIPER
jgi:hypothetical protein